MDIHIGIHVLENEIEILVSDTGVGMSGNWFIPLNPLPRIIMFLSIRALEKELESPMLWEYCNYIMGLLLQ